MRLHGFVEVVFHNICQSRWSRLGLLIVFAAVMAGSANADRLRPAVGILPFHAARGHDLTSAVPGYISWELFYIPGIDQTPMQRMMACVDLDRVHIPEDTTDTVAFSKTASSLGVDYLISGNIDALDGSRVIFTTIIYSASNPDCCVRFRHATDLRSLPREAVSAAKQIASALSVPVDDTIRFDDKDIDPRTLPLIDQCIRLQSHTEGDTSELHEAERLADQAYIRYSAGDFAGLLRAYNSRWSVQLVDEIGKLASESHGNLFALSQAVRGYCEIGTVDRARPFGDAWFRIDPASPCASIMTGGNPGGSAFHAGALAWRTDLAIAEYYSLAREIDESRSRFAFLKKRYPNSAYIRVVTGQTLARRGRLVDGAANYREALRLNPDSFRIRMSLAQTCFNSGQNAEASKLLREILTKWPNRSEGHRLAARIYMRSNKLDRAIQEIQIVEKLDPNGEVNHRMLAASYANSGKIIEAAQEIVKADPGVRNALIWTSMVLMGVFLIVVVGIAFIIRAALAPDGKGRKPSRKA